MWRGLILAALAVGVVSQRWEQERRYIAAIAMGIAQGDRNRVYTGGFWNGVGSKVLYSDNNGERYQEQILAAGPFIYSAAAAVGAQALVAGHTLGLTTGIHTTENGGTTWRPHDVPMEFPVSTTQSCEPVPGRTNERFAWFGCVGTFPGGQDGIMRVLFTEDGGATFQRTATIERRLRYGSYPTRDTWYLTGGTWPGLPTKDEGTFEYGWGLSIQQKRAAGANGNLTDARWNYHLNAESHINADPKDFTAFVYKTTDRGATWTNVFNRPGEGFYPQYISCPNVNQCWMTAEGSVGVIIFYTPDGGRTWQQQFSLHNDAQTRYHFYPIVMLNDREGWAAGSKAVFPTMDGIIYRTADGGRTWVEQPAVPGMLINVLDIKQVPGAGLAGHGIFVSWPEQASGTLVLR